jgi:hypothetical protein
MSRSAKVQSIDALQHLGLGVRAFAEETSVALDDLRMDLHRAMQWIQYDQREYWSQELRRAQEAVSEAKLSLERARMFRFGDHEPSCHDEKRVLEAAKRRVEAAREKLEAVKRWSRLLEHESTECRSAIAPLAHWVQTDVPRAVAMLQRLSLALESYVDLEVPAEDAATPAVSEGIKAAEDRAPAAQPGTAPGSEGPGRAAAQES